MLSLALNKRILSVILYWYLCCFSWSRGGRVVVTSCTNLSIVLF